SLPHRGVELLGLFLGHVTQVDIAFDCLRTAFVGLAVPTASGGKKSHYLAGLNQQMAEFSRQRFCFAVALDDRLIHRAFGTAEQAPGRALDSVRVAAQKKILDSFD